jgi:hypothetical protein
VIYMSSVDYSLVDGDELAEMSFGPVTLCFRG